MNKYTKMLSELIGRLDEIAGEWNGDEAGVEEDRTHVAVEAREKVFELRDLLIELEELEA